MSLFLLLTELEIGGPVAQELLIHPPHPIKEGKLKQGKKGRAAFIAHWCSLFLALYIENIGPVPHSTIQFSVLSLLSNSAVLASLFEKKKC